MHATHFFLCRSCRAQWLWAALRLCSGQPQNKRVLTPRFERKSKPSNYCVSINVSPTAHLEYA